MRLSTRTGLAALCASFLSLAAIALVFQGLFGRILLNRVDHRLDLPDRALGDGAGMFDDWRDERSGFGLAETAQARSTPGSPLLPRVSVSSPGRCAGAGCVGDELLMR